MDILEVGLGERTYPILIGERLLGHPQGLAAHVPARDVLLVSNTVVAPLYAQAVREALPGRRIVEAVLPDGEVHKTLATASRLFDVLVANRFGRDAAIVALGGGVVGDMAGFAAATYQRGIDFVQVPTTLLAQVDSSVGGKTGVNHPAGKNLIGAFHQPVAVITDTATLGTLADRELRAGLAEVIKYGLICDAAFFEWIEANVGKILARDPRSLAFAIRRSCELKAQIVARDEREQGERALLNFGHTFGHAIESATHYAGWLHGEAVAAGMLLAADLSQRSGWIADRDVHRLAELLARSGLPTDVRAIPASLAREHMRLDKKVKAGRVRLILLEGIGRAFMSGDYADDALDHTLTARFG